MTQQPEPIICLCQGVCSVYQDGFKLSHNICPLKGCKHDTRIHTSAPAPTDHPLTEDQLVFIIKCERAEAAKAERERTIKEFESWNPFQQSFKDFVESLRQQAGEQNG